MLTDMADADAVEAAVDRVEQELGQTDGRPNVAIATASSPVSRLTAADFWHGTQADRPGQMHGAMAALRRMRRCDRGTSVIGGPALARRSMSLQPAYCGAKAVIPSFTDALRSQIIHDTLAIDLTVVERPAVDTSQSSRAANRTGRRTRPVAPIFLREVPTRATVFVATLRWREGCVGRPTVRAVLANRIAPWPVDRCFAIAGDNGYLTDEPPPADAPANLVKPVPGPCRVHGRLGGQASRGSMEMVASRHRNVLPARVHQAAGRAGA